MKKAKRVVSLVLSVLMVTALAFSVIGCKNSSGGGTSKSKTIAVIAKGETHAFWLSVKSGAQAAAKEAGYTVTFKGPSSESAKDLPSQKEMVAAALATNPAGMVLATIGEGFVDNLKQAKEKNIPVVEFDSGIWANDVAALNSANANPIVSSVATSNKLAAALAAEKFYAALKDEIAAASKYIVGIIQHDETQTGIDRAAGFEEKFMALAEADDAVKGKVVVEKQVKPGDANNAYKDALEALYEKKVNAVYMSNEGVVKQVSDAIGAASGKYDQIKFCGFDAGTKQIEWMKSNSGPKLIGAVAQDSYQIGYQAVKQAIAAIEGKEVTADVAIEGAWWDAANVNEMIKKNLVYEG